MIALLIVDHSRKTFQPDVVALALVVDHELSDILGKLVALPVPLAESG